MRIQNQVISKISPKIRLNGKGRKLIGLGWITGLLRLLLVALPGLAQTPQAPPPSTLPPPQDILPPRPEDPLPQPQKLPPPGDLLPLPPDTPPTTDTPDAPDVVTVNRFEVTGSTVFSPAELAAVTAQFTDRPITIAELFQARSAVTQLYLDNGYINSGAFIPEQTLTDGIVEIRVVEGRLEDIQVEGTVRLNPGYVRSRLAIAAGLPLNRDRLLQALQTLQVNPLIQNLSAELAQGTRPGTSLLKVQITEADSFQTSLLVDNARSPSVGSVRRQVQFLEANLTGLGDTISVSYTNTDGSNALDTSYILPLSPYNTTLAFTYSVSASNVIDPDFEALDIASDAYSYELTLRQPLLQTANQNLALGLTLSHRQTQTTLLGGTLPFPGLGADEEGRTAVSALRFFQEYTNRSNRDVLAFRSQFSLGLGWFNATLNAEAPDSRFLSWRGQAQYVRLLAPDTLLLLRADVQLADRPLLSLEQLGIGGLFNVRGYRQDALLTDSGLFASAELRFPLARFGNGLLQGATFADIGTGWNDSLRPDPDPQTLSSVGLGLRLQLGNQFTARLDWGIPFVGTNTVTRSWQENGLYFSVVYTPF